MKSKVYIQLHSFFHKTKNSGINWSLSPSIPTISASVTKASLFISNKPRLFLAILHPQKEKLLGKACLPTDVRVIKVSCLFERFAV